MNIRPGAVPGVLIIETPWFEDERGSFMETWRQDAFDHAVGAPVRFVQDNWSHSRPGVLRGLHYQLPPQAQGKLVRVLRGAVWDVAVDLRRASPTLGRWSAVELSAGNRLMHWVPPGFAHGFVVLGDAAGEGADVFYKCSAPYAPGLDRGLRWDDPALGIPWPLPAHLAGRAPVMSAKDLAAPGWDRADRIELP